MIRFMSDTRYAGLEKEMQHIPGFRPRRSGMVISHLSDCLENQRSPCERLVTDYVPFYELLEASFTTGDLYDHHDADGFITLFGLPLKVRAMKMQELKKNNTSTN